MGDAAAGQFRRGGEGRVDGHHLRVHGERVVGLSATNGLLMLLLLLSQLWFLRFTLVLLALLHLRFHLGKGKAIQGAACDAAMLECAAVKSWPVVVMALTNDFTAAHNDTSVAVAEG
jgi:hypothetical protein